MEMIYFRVHGTSGPWLPPGVMAVA